MKTSQYLGSVSNPFLRPPSTYFTLPTIRRADKKFLVAKQDSKTTLLGSNLKEETTCLRWASFTDYELLPPIMAWINPIIGRAPSSPEILAQLEQNCELTVRTIEKEIAGKKFLVGNTLTIADLFVISGLARGYQFVSCLQVSGSSLGCLAQRNKIQSNILTVTT